MIQNLIWATGYNVVALPLAAAALYAWGILLTPAVGAVLMAGSTVVVAINARMLRLKPASPPEAQEPEASRANAGIVTHQSPTNDRSPAI